MPEGTNQESGPGKSSRVIEHVAMDVGEEHTTARSGGTHEAKGGINRFGTQIIGYPFPEKQGATQRVKSGSLHGLIEMTFCQIDRDEDRVRGNESEEVAQVPLFFR